VGEVHGPSVAYVRAISLWDPEGGRWVQEGRLI
jgi:hypothetical protein